MLKKLAVPCMVVMLLGESMLFIVVVAWTNLSMSTEPPDWDASFAAIRFVDWCESVAVYLAIVAVATLVTWAIVKICEGNVVRSTNEPDNGPC